MQGNAYGKGGENQEGSETSPHKGRGFFNGDKVPADFSPLVDAFGMIHPGKFACKQLGKGFQLTDHVLALVRLQCDSVVWPGCNFKFKAAEFLALESHRSGQMRRDFFKQPVGCGRGHKPEGVVFQSP